MEEVADRHKTVMRQAQDKFKEWMVEIEMYAEEQRKKQEELMLQNKRQMEALQASLSHLKDQASKNKQAIEHKKTNLQTLRTEYDSMMKETDQMLQEKETLEQAISNKKQEVDQQKEAVEQQKKAVEEKLSQYDKAAEMYQQNLGLKFQKIPGDKLQVIFTYIDPKDPERPFFFSLKLDANKSYIVSDCEPHLEDLPALTEELNKTNNLRSFMLTIRKRFHDTALQS